MSRIKNWVMTKIASNQAEDGQGLAEYGLILALIAVACIIALEALGGGIAATLGSITAKL